MKRLPSRAPFAALTLLVLAGGVRAARADKSATCVKWRPETVATGFGYNHVVVLDNTCDRAAVCKVSTNVAPDPIQATLASKEHVELTTFRGSPSYTFQARVDCTLQ
jgi:hypothetical protein